MSYTVNLASSIARTDPPCGPRWDLTKSARGESVQDFDKAAHRTMRSIDNPTSGGRHSVATGEKDYRSQRVLAGLGNHRLSMASGAVAEGLFLRPLIRSIAIRLIG